MKKFFNFIQNNEKKKAFSSVFLAISFIILILFFYKADLKDVIIDHITHVVNVDEEQFIYDFTNEMQLLQKFSSPVEFDYITLSISNHDKVITGKTIIEIWGENGNKPLIEQEIVNTDIHVAGPYKISFTDIGGGKAEQIYEVRISAVDTESAALGFFGYRSNETGIPAVINGISSEYSLSIGCHSMSARFMIMTWSILLVCFVMIMMMAILIHHRKMKEEHYFLAIIIPMGIAMFLFLNLNRINDFDFHYISVYRFSNVLLGIQDEEVNRTIIRTDDVELFGFFGGGNGKVNSITTPVLAKMIYQYSKVADEFALVSKDTTLTISGEHRSTEQDVFWSRLPAVLGLTVGRLLHLGAYPCLYLARIASYLFFVIMGYYAIRKTIVVKRGFVFALTLPAVMHIATTVTYDNAAIALSFVVGALIFKMWKSRLSKKELLVLWTFIIWLGGCKGGIYLTIVLLTFFISVQKNQVGYSKKEKLFLPLITCGLAGMSMLINYGAIILRRYIIIPESVEKVFYLSGNKYKLGWAFENPLAFLGMYIRAFIKTVDEEYLGTFLGNDPGWISPHLVIPWGVMLLFAVLLILSIIPLRQDSYKVDGLMRIFCIVVVAGVSLGLGFILITDTGIGSESIYGIQGRYYLPLAPLIFIILHKNGLYYEQGHEKSLYLYWVMAETLFLYYYMRNGFFALL